VLSEKARLYIGVNIIMEEIIGQKEAILKIMQWLQKNYWTPIYKQVKDNPKLVSVVPGFLIAPIEIILYFGRNHLAIEYMGHEVLKELPPEEGKVIATLIDYSLKEGSFLNNIIGFEFNDGTMKLQIPPINIDLVIPTNAGFDKLAELKWNWAAQDMFVCLNTGGIEAPKGQFTRIINGRFFDADDSGLKSRHIKWLDMAPLTYSESYEDHDTFDIDLSVFKDLAKVDALTPYPLPTDYKYEKLPKVNRFVELLGNKGTRETDITGFLADPDFNFILMMRFSTTYVKPQCVCEWQYGEHVPIKPDFFVVGSDGFADIVEFKLPEIKSAPVVGQQNRETFSAELNSYISQTRVYREYFDDPRNRDWVQSKCEFKVYKPKRYLIIGRRWQFSPDVWREIAADYNDLFILTYDDLIDGVVVQFYQ
jgi:hypothetical protein